MSISIGRKASDWIVAIYLIFTLWGRWYIEPQLQGNLMISVGLGVFALVFIWALAQSRIINPSFFGPGSKEESAHVG